jgi:tight adherence protein B
MAATLVAVAALLWPERFSRRRLAVLPVVPPAVWSARRSGPLSVPGSVTGSAQAWARRCLPHRSVVAFNARDLLSLLEAIAPALEAGMAPAPALEIAADARSGSGRPDPLAALAGDLASASARGEAIGPLWREAAESAGSAELLLLSQAWSLTEDLGVPLAQAVRTTAGLLEARIAHERQLAGSVAGARATVNLLTLLPLGGPLLGLVLGVGPADLYSGSPLTQASLVLGVCLAGLGRWWVRRMVRAVARGPVIA